MDGLSDEELIEQCRIHLAQRGTDVYHSRFFVSKRDGDVVTVTAEFDFNNDFSQPFYVEQPVFNPRDPYENADSSWVDWALFAVLLTIAFIGVPLIAIFSS